MARILLSRLLLSAFVVLVFTASIAVAQTTINDQQGFKPFDSLSAGDVDSVSLTSGGLVLHIPLASFPQRGDLDLSFAVYYSGAQWYVQRHATPPSLNWTFGPAWMAAHPTSSMDWWRQKGGTVDTSFYMNAISPDGNHHPVSLVDYNPCGVSGTIPTRTLDASGVLIPDCNTVVLPNGTRFSYLNSPGFMRLGYGSTDTATQPSSMTDRNGNQVTLTTSGWHDTLGRLIPGYQKNNLIVPGAATSDLSACPSGTASAEVWNVPDLAGGTRTFKFCYAYFSLWTNFQVAGVQDWPPTNTLLMNAIVLPNLTLWTFSYDNYGNVTRLGLPSGGSISYTYQVLSQSPCVQGNGNALIRVASRAVNANDGTGAHTWTYTYGTGTTTVTSPDANDAVHAIVNPFSSTDQCYLYETQAQYFQGSGTSGSLLKTVTTQYAGNSSSTSLTTYVNVVPTQITTTWANGQSRKTVNTYDPGVTTASGDLAVLGSLIQRDEYDFSGSLARSTINHYLWQDNSTYLNNNFLSLLASVTVKDGGGTQVAKSSHGYDEVAVSPSGISTPSLVAPPAGGNIRGNQTTASRWLNTTNSMISSTAAFFDTGMKASGTDPLGHTTTYVYSSAYLGAYRTQTCNPQTNGINHCVSASYDYNTGLEKQFTNENGLVTTTQYDLMHRQTQISYPDGGQTTYCYTDTGGAICTQGSAPFSALTAKKINISINLTSTTKFDGLGRVIQTQLTSDPQGTVYTDTTYDAVGRVATVSNPYRSGADITTTTGTTTYGYDALSRKTTETYPDNSVLTTAYCGSSTLVTDPTGKWRRSRTDGLGRLVEVDEPNAVGASVASTGCPGTGEPIWVTSYTYDGLSNLTQVVQNGSRQRNFTYDSFSRLLTSANPEVGQITYTYNNDGVLISKTDARNITTNYSPSDSPIDALHRVTKITYSNSDPTVTFSYDQSNCLGLTTCQNIGQRTSMTDAAGSEAWSYQVDATNHRSVHVNQRTTSSITKTSTYYLDLAGNVTQAVYPTGRVVNYTYNAANRPITAADGSNGITYATDFQTAPTGCLTGAVCYTPQGSFYALSIGQTASFTGLNLTHSYNNRLQPNEFKASSSGGNAIDITYGFVDPLTSHNAGHVYGITNNLDSTRSQTFSYDQLNRITAALTTSTYATSPAHCWGETYSSDAWGNLQSIAATTNSSYTGCSQESGFTKTADGNNHLSGLSYDLSGNTTNDGVNSYVWDGESQLKSAAGATYTYDGDGRRVAKVGSKLYWYGSGGDILAETDASGNTTAEYIFFGGKRVAMLPAGGNPIYYVEDLLGTSRVLTTNAGVVCYDADFYPYGGERSYTNTCPQNYKFEGKERDTETGNDDFGARYYSNRFGRWLSADWSSVPTPVPYANLTNPQTLNLYAMVSDDPESFADLDGHIEHSMLDRLQDQAREEFLDNEKAAEEAAAQQQAAQNANQQTTEQPVMRLEPISSTVATDKNDGKPVITADSIFQEKVSVSDVKNGSATLTVSLQTSDGRSIPGVNVLISGREGTSARVGGGAQAQDHGPIDRTVVVGISGHVDQSQGAKLVFTLFQNKKAVATGTQPVHLISGQSSHTRRELSRDVGGKRDRISFPVP